MINYEVDDGEKLYSLNRNKAINFDIETCKSSGSKDYDTLAVATIRQGDIRLFYYFDTVNYTMPTMISPHTMAYILNEFKYIVGHNVQYDLNFMARYGYTTHNLERLIDTLYGARLKFPQWREKYRFAKNSEDYEDNEEEAETAYSLNDVARRMFRELGMSNPYDNFDKKTIRTKFSTDTPPTEDMIQYALTDVEVLPILVRQMLDVYDMKPYKIVERAIIEAFNIKGMPVDWSEVNKVFGSIEAQILPKDTNKVIPISETKMITQTLKTAMKQDTLKDLFISVGSSDEKKMALGLEFSADRYTLDVIQHRPLGIEGLEYSIYEIKAETKRRLDMHFKRKHTETASESLDGFLLTYYGNDYAYYVAVIDRPTTTKVMNRLPKPLTRLREPLYIHSEYKKNLAKSIARQQHLVVASRFKARVYKYANKDSLGISRITSTYTSTVAVTTRLQAKKENLLQYSREVKSIFGVKQGSGRVLVYADWGQAELRSLMVLMGSKRSNMYLDFMEGIDIHTKTTLALESILPPQLVEELHLKGIKTRNIGKVANFGLLYGAGAGTLQGLILKSFGIWIDLNIVKQFVYKWKELYSDIAEWQDRNQHTNITYSMYGRPFYYYNSNSNYTDRNNHQNQCSASEFEHTAFASISKRLRMEFVEAYLVNYQYDSYTIECREQDYKQIADVVAYEMKSAWNDFKANSAVEDLPMPVDVFVGYNWGKIEKEAIYSKTY